MLEEKFAALNVEVNNTVEKANQALMSTLRDNANLKKQVGADSRTIEFAKNSLVLSWSITCLVLALRFLGW